MKKALWIAVKVGLLLASTALALGFGSCGARWIYAAITVPGFNPFHVHAARVDLREILAFAAMGFVFMGGFLWIAILLEKSLRKSKANQRQIKGE